MACQDLCAEITDVCNRYVARNFTLPAGGKYIFVDLGNIHDLLPQLDNPCYQDYHVYAFADKCFNGYGVKEKCTHNHISVIQSVSDSKNAADVRIICAAQRVFSHAVGSALYIATKDKGFLELRHIAKEHGCELTFFCHSAELLAQLQQML